MTQWDEVAGSVNVGIEEVKQQEEACLLCSSNYQIKLSFTETTDV